MLQQQQHAGTAVAPATHTSLLLTAPLCVAGPASTLALRRPSWKATQRACKRCADRWPSGRRLRSRLSHQYEKLYKAKRATLVGQTKAFVGLDDAGKLAQLGALIKEYQATVDLLTKRR